MERTMNKDSTEADEAEESDEAFKAAATMEAVEDIINKAIHKIISKQIKIFTTDIIRIAVPCLKLHIQAVLRVHQVCHHHLKHIITKACPTGAINHISADSTDGDNVTATCHHESIKMATGCTHV